MRGYKRHSNIVEDRQTLRHEVDTLRAVLSSITEGVIVADQDGMFLFFNPVAERILGIGSRDVTPAEWTSVYGCYRTDKVTPYPPEQLPLARAIRGEEVIDDVIYIKNSEQPKGVWISVSGSPLKDSTGSVKGGLVIFREITKRQNALEKITVERMNFREVVSPAMANECQACLHYFAQFRANYERLAEAVEQTADSIVITNKQGVIEYVNAGFEATTGYSREEALGKTPRILRSGRHDREFYEKLWDQITSGDHYRGTILNKKKNGELYWAEQTITPIKDNDGNITSFVSVLKDITELKKKQEQDFQLGIAREVQQQFYPTAVSLPGFDIAGAAYPADETGGDYFDYITTPDGCLWIVVGDISGHGIGSALIMAETRAYLRAYAKIESGPGEVLTRINQELTADTDEERFVTMILARLDPNDFSLAYASAGHVPGYLLSSSGDVISVMRNTGIPLGCLQDYTFSSSEQIRLAPGNIAVFFTDGITEATDPDRTEFGFNQVIDTINRHRQASARQIVQRLYQAVRSFSENLPQEDDITAIICKVDSID